MTEQLTPEQREQLLEHLKSRPNILVFLALQVPHLDDYLDGIFDARDTSSHFYPYP
jgi:hypothetical protein